MSTNIARKAKRQKTDDDSSATAEGDQTNTASPTGKDMLSTLCRIDDTDTYSTEDVRHNIGPRECATPVPVKNLLRAHESERKCLPTVKEVPNGGTTFGREAHTACWDNSTGYSLSKKQLSKLQYHFSSVHYKTLLCPLHDFFDETECPYYTVRSHGRCGCCFVHSERTSDPSRLFVLGVNSEGRWCDPSHDSVLASLSLSLSVSNK